MAKTKSGITKKSMFKLLKGERGLEEQLRRERDRVELIVSSMGEGLLVIDKNHKLTIINPVAENLLGVKEKEVLGRDWSDIVKTLKNVEQTPVAERSFARAIAEGKTIVTGLDDDHYYQTKSGKKFPIISITAPLKTEKGIIGAVKVFRDATPEKESKAIIEQKVEERTHQLKEARDKISKGWLQLQQEKARLTASINNLPLGFFIIDRDHKIVIMNSAMKEILDSPRKNWTFKTLAARFEGTDIDLGRLCAHCRDDASSYKLDEVDYDGKILRVISVPITMQDSNKVIGTAIVIEDVTEAKLLERTKDEFFAVASHELRTPLTAIRGNTSLIQQYFADKIEDKDFQEMIADMHDASVRLIKIVNDFLDASRLEQGRIEFKKENLGLDRLVQETMDDFENRAREKGLYLRFEKVDGYIPEVLADKGRTREVIANLVDNAIEFTEKGEVKVAVGKKDGFLQVKVKDSGAGISKKNQKLLFKKFQQAGERVLARDITRGTGMGLYISKLMVEGMGGKIYLEGSELGKGSTFVFTLPIAKDG